MDTESFNSMTTMNLENSEAPRTPPEIPGSPPINTICERVGLTNNSINQQDNRFKNVIPISSQIDYEKYITVGRDKKYMLKVHNPLLFATGAHLSFILSGKNPPKNFDELLPISCAKCGKKFTRDTSGMRFICNGKNQKDNKYCNGTMKMSYFKAYLMDLCNHKRLFIMTEEDAMKFNDQSLMETDLSQTLILTQSQSQTQILTQTQTQDQTENRGLTHDQTENRGLTEEEIKQKKIEQELNKRYVLVFTDGKPNGKFKMVSFHSPNYENDLKNPHLSKPVFINSSQLKMSVADLRNYVTSPFDYIPSPYNANCEEALSNKEILLDLFYKPVFTFSTATQGQGTKASKVMKRRRNDDVGQAKTLEDFINPPLNINLQRKEQDILQVLKKNNISMKNNESIQIQKEFNLDTFNNLIKENNNMKKTIYEMGKNFNSLQERVEFIASNISMVKEKIIENSNKINLYAQPLSYAEVLSLKADSPSRKKAISTFRERARKIVEEGEEKKRKKLEQITNIIQKNKEDLPKSLKEVVEIEDGVSTIQKGYIGLTTKSKKEITKDNIIRIYLKGVYRKPVRYIRECFSNIGIKKKYIKNISFVSKDICELMILKEHKKNIYSILKYFKDIEILENYDPLKCENDTLKEIGKTENAFFNRISGIIQRKKTPDFIKMYCLSWLETTEFKTLTPNKNKNSEKGKEPIVQENINNPQNNVYVTPNNKIITNVPETPSRPKVKPHQYSPLNTTKKLLILKNF